MPLHLLGKKSWNVYNADNIERVRRDEADAQAREEAAEQRAQEEDAQRRIALLRGEQLPPLPPLTEQVNEEQAWRQRKPDDDYTQRDRKRRRIRGEDDTARDIRYARHETESGQKEPQALLSTREKEAPLEDGAGHIQLIPAPDTASIRKAEKNAELEAEKAKKRRREEDQYTMRFSNAAGFQTGMQKPWYTAGRAPSPAAQATDVVLADLQEKDVWGNEDLRRKGREQSRIISNDPFSAMQQAQRQLKQSVRDKDAWQAERRAELEQLQRRQEHRARRQRREKDDEDSLVGFSLDAPDHRNGQDKHQKHRYHHRRRHHGRSGSRVRGKDTG